MKVELQTYTEGKDVISLKWERGFEESVIKEVFGESSVLDRRFANCIHLEKMDDELDKIIEKYFKKKQLKDSAIVQEAKGGKNGI